MGKLYYQDKAGDIKVTSKGIPSPTDETAVAEALNEQSETLFKTINGIPIVGEGDIPVGGGSVIANPEMEGSEPDLTGIEIDGNKYKIPEGGSTSSELVTDISLYCEIFSGYFEINGRNIPEYTTIAELYEILAPYNGHYIVTEFEHQYSGKFYDKVSYFHCQRNDNNVEIYLTSDFGDLQINATDDEEEEGIIFNPTFQNFKIESDLYLNLVYGESTPNSLDWLQDLTTEDYSYLAQKIGALTSLTIVIFTDSEAQNPPLAVVGVEADLNQNIEIYTANGPIIIAMQPDHDHENKFIFNVIWDYFVLPGGGVTPTPTSGLIGCYVGVPYVDNNVPKEHTSKVIPILKYTVQWENDAPVEYLTDDFYMLMQAKYASLADKESLEFNLPTFLIERVGQPINVAMFAAEEEITGFSVDVEPVTDYNPGDEYRDVRVSYTSDSYTNEGYIKLEWFGDFPENSIEGFIANIHINRHEEE